MSNGPVNSNSYQNNENLLTVHIIPHSHDDIGWRMTIDEYYVKAIFLLNLGSKIHTNVADSSP